MDRKWSFLLFILLSPGVINAKDKGKLYSPTTNAGQHFLVAFVSLTRPLEPLGLLTITSMQLVGTVSITLPSQTDNGHGAMDKVFRTVLRDRPVVYTIPNYLRIPSIGVGQAVVIESSVPVTVLMTNYGGILSGDVTLVPHTDTYGYHYVVLSQAGASWIVLLASSSVQVLVKWGMGGGKYNEIKCVTATKSKCIRGGQNTVPLSEGQYFYFYTAAENAPDFTGTELTAEDPFGVMVGNFWVKVEDQQGEITDFTIAFPRPVHTWGRVHVAPGLGSMCRQVAVISSQVDTTLTIYNSAKSRTVKMGKRYATVQFSATKTAAVFESDKPVAVTLTLYTCHLGQALLLYLLPNEQFVNSVFFRLTPVQSIPQEWKVVLIAPTSSVAGFVMNVVPVDPEGWRPVDVYKSQAFSIRLLTPSSRLVTIIHMNPGVRFAAYLYTTTSLLTMATETGALYRTLQNWDSCVVSQEVLADDLVDNDCDGSLDEEIQDFEDDDGDGKIDEDTTTNRVNGSWAEWMPWYCPAECGKYGFQVRHRECSEPVPQGGGIWCLGSGTAIGNSCYVNENQTCPYECPVGLFSPSCSINCSARCGGGRCERFQGICLSCDEGEQLTPYCTPVPVMQKEERSYARPGSVDYTWLGWFGIPLFVALVYIAVQIAQAWPHREGGKEQAMEEMKGNSPGPQ